LLPSMYQNVVVPFSSFRGPSTVAKAPTSPVWRAKFMGAAMGPSVPHKPIFRAAHEFEGAGNANPFPAPGASVFSVAGCIVMVVVMRTPLRRLLSRKSVSLFRLGHRYTVLEPSHPSTLRYGASLVAMAAVTGEHSETPAGGGATGSTTRLHMMATSGIAPPVAAKKPHTLQFGHVDGENRGPKPMDPPIETEDVYYWMRDDDRSNPEVIAHLNAENDYTTAMTKSLEPFQEQLYKEMKGHLQETDEDYPYPHGDYLYYTKTEEGKSYKVHCRRPAAGGPEEVVLDENVEAEGLPYFEVGTVKPSPTHQKLVYTVDTKGHEDYQMVIKDLQTGARIETVPGQCSGEAEWGDDEHLYYLRRDENHREYQVWRHQLGADTGDVLLLEETDGLFTVDIYKSQSGRFLMADVESKETTETAILDLETDGPTGAFQVLQKRKFGVKYDVGHRGEFLYMRTNRGSEAQNFTILCRPVAEAAAAWQPLEGFAYDAKRYVTRVLCLKDHLAVFGRQDGFTKMWVLAMGEQGHVVEKCTEVAFEAFPCTVQCSVNKLFDTHTVRVGYQSLVDPESVVDVDLNTLEKVVRKQKQVPNYDRSLYSTCVIHAKARDGTEIPVSIHYRKDLHKEGRPEPLMLYGYGSYGACMDPRFRIADLSLVDRGVVHAVANIRGGGEMGMGWYEDQGKYFTKMNTFTDFIDVADHLVSQKWTTPDQMAIHGRSAGGLLIGAVVNMRPDLCKVALAGVPFVDVMCTMRDPSIPLTILEWEEWGNPNERDYYDYMNQYSPVDNVTAQHYPAIFVTAGLHDPRVAYWEPAKWVAKLRDLKTDDNLVLLKMDMVAGHFSASDRYKYLRETAIDYAFVLEQLGLAPK